MIYTADMVANAVETASRAARDVARADERERCCRIIATHAEMTGSVEAREAIWEAILQIRDDEVAS